MNRYITDNGRPQVGKRAFASLTEIGTKNQICSEKPDSAA